MPATPCADAPDLDYRATLVRPRWEELPEGVRAEIGRVAGSRVVRAEDPPGSGFTGGFAAIVHLADGRAVFAKAGSAINPHIVTAYAQEAEVLQLLPRSVPAPRHLGHSYVHADVADGHGWQILITEAVRGTLPQPWTERDVELVHDACLVCASALTPAPADLDLPSLMETFGQDPAVLNAFTNLRNGALTLTGGQPPWVPERYDELQELVSSAAAVLTGPTACHGDLRADNVLIVSGDSRDARAVLVDWNWLMLGPAWIDFVGILPLARADGVDVDAWLRRSPLTRYVNARAIDVFLATIAAFMLRNADEPTWPGGAPLVRVHQRRYASTYLDWLGARNGWS
jgi:hypothetical protein